MSFTDEDGHGPCPDWCAVEHRPGACHYGSPSKVVLSDEAFADEGITAEVRLTSGLDGEPAVEFMDRWHLRYRFTLAETAELHDVLGRALAAAGAPFVPSPWASGSAVKTLGELGRYDRGVPKVECRDCDGTFDPDSSPLADRCWSCPERVDGLVPRRATPGRHSASLRPSVRPDAKSLPTGISGNAILRFALKVMDHTTNDMILGASAHKNGIKATMFARRDLGIGWLSGEEDEPTITRTFYVDGPGAEIVVTRARTMREEAGTLPRRPGNGTIDGSLLPTAARTVFVDHLKVGGSVVEDPGHVGTAAADGDRDDNVTHWLLLSFRAPKASRPI